MASTCRACGKPLFWVQTKNGKYLPCDEGLTGYRKDQKGHDVLIGQDGSTIRCRLQFEGEPDGYARIPHWATCSSPDKFRKDRKKKLAEDDEIQHVGYTPEAMGYDK